MHKSNHVVFKNLSIIQNYCKKKPDKYMSGFILKKATTYSPTIAVPSALMGLTSLFGMGRGEPHCYSHLKASPNPSEGGEIGFNAFKPLPIPPLWGG